MASVSGLVVPADPLVRPYTGDPSQVQMRIFALAPGATLRQSHFTDFWTRAAAKWKNHPGFGGYGLMNEPHDMPRPGEIVESTGEGEDLTIWPAYAQAAIKAIRAVDPVNPIYLGGNGWSSAASLGTSNPGWPLAGDNIVYEVHLYLDARSNGHAFDYEIEAGKKFSAGVGNVPIDHDTGIKRLQPAVEWARAKGVKLALTETGMPIDDPRWEEMFKRMVTYARQSGCEVYSWMGGNHWPIRNYAINHVPGWHQNKTLEPAVSGPLKASAGIAQGVLFDDGPGWAAAGGAVTITVYARGNLARPLKLAVRSGNGGRLSKASLNIPAGPNGFDSFTFTPDRNGVTTLTYESADGVPPPPPRKVYSLANPVAYAATSLADAALAIVAKYDASKWEMADGYTDYMQGAPAAAGQPVRAVSDSGYGSTPGNAMEMINWVNTDSRHGIDGPSRHARHPRAQALGSQRARHLGLVVPQIARQARCPAQPQEPHRLRHPGPAFRPCGREHSGAEQQRCGVPGLERAGVVQLRPELPEGPPAGALDRCRRSQGGVDRPRAIARQHARRRLVHLGARRAKPARQFRGGGQRHFVVRARSLRPAADRLGLPELFSARGLRRPCLRGDHRPRRADTRRNGSARTLSGKPGGHRRLGFWVRAPATRLSRQAVPGGARCVPVGAARRLRARLGLGPAPRNSLRSLGASSVRTAAASQFTKRAKARPSPRPSLPAGTQ